MTKRAIVLSAILVTCIVGQDKSASNAIGDTATAEILPFTSMSYEIEVPTEEVLKLLPIPIVVRQVNKTSRPVYGYY
ncbi:MAG: hypothetical protein LC734_04640, partial [Acidobacteria bacterium]|nr:hypothetical protein [Acidobacteriota bacterium]